MDQSSIHSRRPQFRLIALFQYVTLCGVLAGLSGILGMATSACLMGLALALGARQGGWALISLVAASLAADAPVADGSNRALAQQLAMLLVAALMCGWFRTYRDRREVSKNQYGGGTAP